MKKVIISIFTIIAFAIFSNVAFSTDINEPSFTEGIENEQNIPVQTPGDMQNDAMSEENKNDNQMSPAGEEIISAVTTKDKKIAELTDKYNDKTLGMVAYYLEIVRFYSTPIFFIFLTIGAFNFFIIGNKKLDKKEQGFGWITACIIGWVFFQCIPLIFALFVL